MRKGFLLWIGMTMWSFAASASYHRQAPSSVIVGKAQLATQINQILREYPQAEVGVYIKSMKYGDTLYAQNINRPFIPASVMKILTAESALLFLGPNYRFNTQLMTDAKSINKGVLSGNLYLIESGDPSLTYTDLLGLTSLLKSQQIEVIAGNVYIDDSAFDQSYGAPGWAQRDSHYCYAAPISAGIINHNCLAFRIVPARKPGQLARIMASQRYYYPSVQNTVITKARRSRGCYLRLGSSNNGLSLQGCMPKGNYTWGLSYVIENVLAYNQALVKSLLKHYGVHIHGQVTSGKAHTSLLPIAQHESKPLHLIITEMMKKSDNVIAGALFKKIGQVYTKQQGSWNNGSFAVEKILASKIGINTSNMRIIDGSGLSPYNQITPAQMMQVLDFAYHHVGTNYEFISSLPIAGVDGTLKHRMYNISRKVKAKTGSLHGVVSLAGYAASHNKEPLAFVIMVNTRGSRWEYKVVEDKIATLLTEYQR